MKTHTENGWIIYNPKHPSSGKEMKFTYSFRTDKRWCIRDFIKDSGMTWREWSRKWNFKCIRATQTITIEP